MVHFSMSENVSAWIHKLISVEDLVKTPDFLKISKEFEIVRDDHNEKCHCCLLIIGLTSVKS